MMSGNLQLSPFDVLKTYVPSNATDSPAELGAVGVTPDGRRFKLGSLAASATTLAPGKLCQGPVISSSLQAVTCSSQSIGDTQITVTLSAGTAYAANQFAGGFIGIISGTGSVLMLQIKSSQKITTAGTTMILTLVDPIVVALSGSPVANIFANPLGGLVVMPTTLTGAIAGIPMISVVADSTYSTFVWMQTGGLALALVHGTINVGLGITYSTTSTPVAGALEVATATLPNFGTAVQAGVDTAYSFVDLRL